MSNLDAREQLMLELVNRARMDPAAEAARFGINLNQGLAPGTITETSKEVYAGNEQLNQAANAHSRWMLTHKLIGHFEDAQHPTHSTGFSPTDRIEAAGYLLHWNVGENVSIHYTSGANTTAFKDNSILTQHGGLFKSAGHRQNILQDSASFPFREIGIGQLTGAFVFGKKTYIASAITQAFALGDPDIVFVTGVVYNDTKKADNFYSIGEGKVGFAVGGGAGDTTGAGGGYEIGFDEDHGAQTLTFGARQIEVTVGTRNIKLDFVNGSELWTDTTATVLTDNVTEIHALSTRAINLTGAGGSEKIFGNSAVNVLTGNGGEDMLDGGGNADTMFGGTGNDIYVVNDAGDIVNETGGDGTDTVRSSISFDLGGASVIGDVENLILVGATVGNATGNALDNVLTGSAKGNTLMGLDGLDTLRGGLGNDTLFGGNDADTFVFNSKLNATTNRDTIADFNPAEDVIHLDNAFFTKLGAPRNLPGGFFKPGANASDPNDYIVYNPANGALFYDANGKAPGQKILFAIVTGAPVLTAADFVII
jgi:Ca2+-binding RTX toxin-like protein